MTKPCPFCKNVCKPIFALPHGEVLKCSKCSLRFLGQQPDDAELAKRYANLYYSAIRVYTQTEEAICVQIIENHLKPLLTLTAGGSAIVDYGSGDGIMVNELRKLGFQTFGVDPFGKTEPDKNTFKSFEDLKLRGNLKSPPQLILLNEVVEHLRAPWETLKMLWGRLPEGGVLYVSTPNFQGLRSVLLRAKYEQYINPTHLFYFTPGTLKRVLSSACDRSPDRLRTQIRYPDRSPIGHAKDRLLQITGMDGDLKFAVTKMP